MESAVNNARCQVPGQGHRVENCTLCHEAGTCRNDRNKLMAAQVQDEANNQVVPELKPTNPKDGIGITKVPLHLVSGVVKAYQAIAHYLGNVKYGAWNYRACGARASVYKAALDRHMDRWWEGEEFDPADGTPHLANALCCINILIETTYGGNLVDDRPPSRDLNPLYKMVEDLMGKIKERYKDKEPKHYTRGDA